MSKYIDSKNQVDLDKVEEHFQANYKSAEEYAKEKTDQLLAEIKHFRDHSFQELVKELEEEFEQSRERDKKDSKKPYCLEYEVKSALREELSEKYPPSSESDELSHAISAKYNALSDEERLDIYFKHSEKRLAEAFEKRKETLQKIDLLYDMMTEEQVEQLIHLYYMSELKRSLVYKREDAMRKAAKDLGKETKLTPWIYNSAGDKVGFTDNTGLVESHVAKVVKKEEIDSKDIITKDKIIANIKDAIKQVGIPTLIAIGATGIIGALSKGPGYTAEWQGASIEVLPDTSNINVLQGVIKTAPIILAIFLARYGIKKISEIKDKDVIEEAKKFGLYDTLVEKMKAKNDYDAFKTELVEARGFDEEISERIGRYGDGRRVSFR